MMKVELHTHTADDPADLIPHSTIELIERAADLGFGALAITLHGRFPAYRLASPPAISPPSIT
jgi:histidinol phosphatase-like PHP family hydrolase